MQHGRFLSGFWRLWPPDHPISEQIDSGEGGAWREKKGRGTGRVPYARPRCAGARLWRPVEPARAPQPFSRSATGSDTDSTKRCHEEKRRRSASLAARGAPEATTGDRARVPEAPRGSQSAPERSGRQRQALDPVFFQLDQQPLGFRPLGWIVGQVPDAGYWIVEPARRFEPVAAYGRGTGRVPYARPRCAGARLWRPVEPARAPHMTTRQARWRT